MQRHHKLKPAYSCYSRPTLAAPTCSSALLSFLVFLPRSAQRTSLSLSFAFRPLTPCLGSTTSVEIINYCHQQIDPGFAPPVIGADGATGGFVLDSREHAQVELPAGWVGTIWPRTGCDSYGTCETGQCPGGVNCTGPAESDSGATLARFRISNTTYVVFCSVVSEFYEID